MSSVVQAKQCGDPVTVDNAPVCLNNLKINMDYY